MTDESTRTILAETAVTALEETGRKRFFGNKKRPSAPLTHCENCGAELRGPYCSACGQAAVDYRRSFRHVFADVLDSFLNWDSKFLATIGLLLTRPWRLTNEFLSGKRIHYLHPLRLYLLVSIVFFLGVQKMAQRAHIPTAPPGHAELTPEARAKIDNAMTKLPADVQKEVRDEVARSSDEKPFLQIGTNAHNGDTPFEKWMNERVKDKIGENGTKAQFFFLTLVSNIPGMMLCCIPLFAFVLKILYLLRRIFYIDHLIYALHIHAFAYLATMVIVSTTIALKAVAPHFAGYVMTTLIIIAVGQVFLSIRNVYRQGWFMTVVKFFAGGLVYLIVLSTALAATVFVTLAMP